MPASRWLFFLGRALLRGPAALIFLLLLLSGSSLQAITLPATTASDASASEAAPVAEAYGDAGPSRAGRLSGEERDPKYSYSVRGGFSVPQNDLRQTTGPSPQISIGAHGERLMEGVHQLRAVGEWWWFREGHQYSDDGTRSQVIDTKVTALALGGEYLYRIGGADKRLSAGVGLYMIRWSIDSVDTITFTPDGTAQSSGNSSWIKLGESYGATYRLSHRLELEGRWIHSHYGYENIPVNNVIYGAGWRF